jgi:hypothetical protein
MEGWELELAGIDVRGEHQASHPTLSSIEASGLYIAKAMSF